ncbi:MAG TPA: porin family protein [Saprospiraceae bacterium]|nr:porin family protein [Saprospiraceae bacterium]HNS13586.1 porin family protein [Bacteroidia bacterium]
MKAVFILNFLFLISQVCTAQKDFGARLNTGFSKMVIDRNDEGISQKNFYIFSALSGLYASFYTNENSFIGTELLYNRVSGEEEIVFNIRTGSGLSSKVETITLNYRRHISYLSVPVYYGFLSDRFLVRAGVQLSMLLQSDESLKYDVPDYIMVNYTQPGRLDIDKYDYGLLIGLGYRFYDNAEFEISYYHGLNDIYDGQDNATTWRNSQFTAGFRYTFFKSTK